MPFGLARRQVYHDDDLRGECFRKYKRVEDSYDDHSRFLAERSRYERLFKLNIKDYKAGPKDYKNAVTPPIVLTQIN